MSTTPIPAPPKKSSALWWILGALSAVVVIFILGGLLLATYFAKNLRIEESAKRVEISTPAGELKVSKGPEADTTGLPVYPAATVVESGATIDFTPADEKSAVGIAAAHYRTSDPFEKIEAWYRERLGPEFRPERAGSMVRIGKVEVGRADIAFISEKGEFVRMVALKRVGNGAEIALVRIGQREPQ